MARASQPVLFVSHGATIYTSSRGDPTHAWLASLAPRVASVSPRAIVVVSAHHVTSGEWAVTSSARPSLMHDVGAAGADAGTRVHAGFQHGLSMSAFLFGALAA